MALWAALPGGGKPGAVAGGQWQAMNNGLVTPSVLALALAPTPTPTLFAGTLDGIYASRDGGLHWRYLKNGLRGLTTTALAIDPQTPTTVYAGSGGLIFRSADAGHSWQDITQWVLNTQASPRTRPPAGLRQR